MFDLNNGEVRYYNYYNYEINCNRERRHMERISWFYNRNTILIPYLYETVNYRKEKGQKKYNCNRAYINLRKAYNSVFRSNDEGNKNISKDNNMHIKSVNI